MSHVEADPVINSNGFHLSKYIYCFSAVGGVVVSVMDSHSCDRGSSPGQGNHVIIRFSLNNILFISD